ncbi:MAG: cyclase [Planctomycetota bacterium]|nr:MAG: cyclase [Planctomycetota bacterium]
MFRIVLPCALLASLFLLPAASPSRQDPTQVELQVVELTDKLSVIMGMGGNIGVYHGSDGVLMVDDQFASLSDRILAKLATISDGDLRFLVNTHWHWDHSEGNENMAAAGALIVAHENVRARMSVDQVMPAFNRTVEASPESALPVITYADGLSFHWNGGRVNLKHMGAGHTDGDSIVHFVDENVLHTGDLFFHGMLPFIDLGSGGSVDGMIDGVRSALALANDDTQIIPGHGPVASKADLQTYLDMLVDVRTRLNSNLEAGFTVEELVAFKLLKHLEADYGGGFMSVDQFTGIAASSLLRAMNAREAGDAALSDTDSEQG